MKKYRCPYCGEECITLPNKILQYRSVGRLQHYRGTGNPCPECNKLFYLLANKNVVLYVFWMVIIIVVPLVFLFIGSFNKLVLGYLLLYAMIVFLFLIPLFALVNTKITQYDQKKHKHIILEPNAEIVLYDVKRRIENLDIFGIRFEKQTNVVRFHETFTNDLVPVVFYKDKKNEQQEVKVNIMKSEFVPEELLIEGSEFIVIDNGKEIAKGRIKQCVNTKD